MITEKKYPLYREMEAALEHYKAIEAAADFSNIEVGQHARHAAAALCSRIRAKPIGNHCPACGRVLLLKTNFCADCGQALNWKQEG